MSEVVPDIYDGVPINDEAEPEDAEVEHLVPPEDLDLPPQVPAGEEEDE